MKWFPMNIIAVMFLVLGLVNASPAPVAGAQTNLQFGTSNEKMDVGSANTYSDTGTTLAIRHGQSIVPHVSLGTSRFIPSRIPG